MSIYAAFVKAQKAFGPALKTSTNPHFKSRYADLSAVVEAVIDALNSNGIAVIQKSHPNESGVSIETVFIHESGESISSGILSVPAAKHDPQGFGSAMTYARRYSLMAAWGIAPEDDDGNAASKPKKQDPAKAIEAILAAPNIPALQVVFQAAVRQFNGDQEALSKITAAKDQRKSDLAEA